MVVKIVNLKKNFCRNMANIFTVSRNSHHTSETRALSSMNYSESNYH